MLCNRIVSAIPRTGFARLALAALTLAVIVFAAALLIGESDIAHAQASDAITGDNITISTTALTLNEGNSVTYTVSLDKSPAHPSGVVIIDAAVRDLANASITLSPSDHQFTAYNWRSPVTFTVTAHPDDNLVNGSATIKHVAYIYGNDHSTSTTVELPSVTVTETDVPRCPTTIIDTGADFYRATGQRWDWEWDENWSERQGCASQNHELFPARYYQFSIPQGKAARNVTITLVADDADPEIYLRSGNQRNGRQLAYNDDYQSNPNRSGNRWISRIRQNLGPGDYTIEAAYRLTANTQYLPAFSLTVDGLNDDVDASPECDVAAAPISSPEPGAPPPLLNAQMNATWNGSCDSTFTALYGHSGTSNARWYKFDVKERGLYTIDLNSDSAHAWMHLRRGDSAKSGNYLARAEGKSGARIQRWLDPGWHTVEATNYHGGETGPFTLNIKETRIRPGSAPSATGATLNLYGWDGSWHYRANTGPHTSCSGAQSGNSVTLTGLSEDATYTYTVYSDASCSNAIASTSFIATASAGVTPGVILTDASANAISSVSVPENGSAFYRVRLAAAPSGGATTVTIAEGTTAPNDDADITVTDPSSKTLTFSTSNWWLPQTVTLSAADDIDKTSGSRDIGHTASGGGYSNVTGSLTAVEIEDDAAIVLSETAVTVPENGSATYTVKLTTPPTADVTVTIAAATTGSHTDDNIRVSSPSNGTLSFTSQNYDTAQTVTLRANSDSDAINGTRDITHTASGGNFDGAPVATVLATERDSQARVNVTRNNSAVSTVTVVEEATATYDVTLNAQPAADVAVTIAEATTGNDTDEHIIITSSTTLTFTPQSYATPQPVTLTAAEDQDLADGRRTITHTAGDAGNAKSGYDGAPVTSITAREDDIDTGGIAFADSAENATTTVSVNEEGTGSYKVKLTHKPTGTVNVQVRAATGGSNDTDITVQDTNDAASGNQTGSIAFSTDNWDTYRTVTLAAADDDDNDVGSRAINHTANGGGYSNITGALTASEVENDATIVFSKSAVSVPEGSTATYTVKLGTAPTANVTVNLIATGWETDITIQSPSSGQLTFCPTASNCTSPNTVWSTAQTVTLAAEEDTDGANASRRIMHRASSTDTNYNNLTVFLTASEVENDKGILVPGFVDVPEGGSANFDVSLHVQPTHDVTVTISENTTGWGIDPDITVTSPASKTLTFTSSNWNIAQAVTVSAAHDDDFESGSRNINFSAASTDAGYQGVSALLFAIEKDDEVGIVLPATASVNEDGTGTYRVRLSAEPTSNVYVSIRAASGSGQDTDITVKDTDDSQTGDQTGSILFTADNWNFSRTVTLAARDDDDKVIGSRTINHSASGGQFNGITGAVTAEEAENDHAILLSKSAVSVPEGSTATYTVKLNARPTANVTVMIAEGTTAPNNDTDITVTSPSSKTLTFCSSSWGCTSPNTLWSAAQTVTLTADEDNDNDSGSRTINHTADSTDTNYDDLTASLTAGEVENDLAIVIRNEADTANLTSLTVNEGGSAKYKVKLAVLPTANVTVALTAATGDDSDITFSPSSLSFNTSNWNQLKTVTVRARQDNSDVAAGTKTITHTANGGNYSNITGTLTATESDNDTGSFVFSPANNVRVSENGTGTYTVKLSHEPGANVTVTLTEGTTAPNNDTDITINNPSLTFTPDNYDTAQTVTLAADDDSDKLSGKRDITHTASGANSGYAGDRAGFDAVTGTMTAVEAEDDLAVLIRNEADASDITTLNVDEGGSAKYKVKLSTQPTASVTVKLTAATGDSDITFSPSSMTFSTSSWSNPKTVTVRARQDNTDVIAGTKTITHTANGGDYVNVTGTLTATEVEDDTLTVVFNPTDDVQVNEGGTGTYTIKLSHKPAANAEISIVCCSNNYDDGDLGIKDTDDSQTGDQTGGPTFTPDNWNIARTITLDADEDNDVKNGQAEITHRINNTGPYYNITAHEVENDPGILIRNYADDSDLLFGFIDVLEGSTERYKVKLATRPAGTVTVTIAEKTGGDSDITISSPSSKKLTFTTGNWNRGQTVTLRAAQDGGSAEGSRVIEHTASGGGYNISTPVELKAYEIDDEKSIIFCPGSGDCYNNTITSIKVTEGRWVDYKVKVSQDTLYHRGNDIFVTLTASGDRDITFDTDIYTEGIQTGSINLGNGNTETIRLYAARDNDHSNSTTNIKHTATSGGYEKLPATLKATEIDNVITLTAAISATSQNIAIDNWWDAWYLKRTSPSVGTCDGPITGLDNNWRYNDLSTGTAYTYKAYSDASCTQEIASGTFTTRSPSLQVGDVTHNSATLWLTNWRYDSGGDFPAYWGSSKSPGGSCQTPSNPHAPNTLTGLSPNTSYTLTAYTDYTCTTEIGRKTVTTLAGASALHTVSNSNETQSGQFNVTLTTFYATSFTTGDEPGGYDLGNITITMSGDSGTNGAGDFAARIYNDSSGKPGSLKTTLVGVNPASSKAYTFPCVSSCRLSANTTYHLALESSGEGVSTLSYRWPTTASDDETVTSVSSGWAIGDTSSKAISGVWTASADTKSGRFSVRAAPVSPYMLPSSVNGTSATLTVYGHTGNWYYKGNKAPHTTCSTAQSTNTASLTGLTAGTEYTYTAYRYSNCSTAIANVTFTTGAGLTEVHVTATTARLDLTGHTGAWWYDDTASAVSCTKVNSGTSPGRVKGMTKNTSYTFKAYSASGCANANELAATTFTTKNPALASSSVTGTTAKLTLSNWATTNGVLGSSNSRDGYWYYKYTVPTSPAGTCTAGPTSPDDSSAFLISSAELSGLSPGTAYTFKAYHDSSCTSSKEIATAASFTTPATLTVKDGTLTTTSATIVLAGNSAAWWLKKTAPTAGSCVSKQSSDTEVALTTLTSAAKHTYKAFSSSASCTSGTGEIASVSFYTTTLAASSITGTGATLTINGHSGSWWYKANQGPHSTCQSGGSTSNNTDAETLSGLSAVTKYTYTAYSASGCAAANLVATETFTTGGVSVSNLGNADSNTLIIGRQFGPAVDSIAVAFTTGSESNGYTLASVTASFAVKWGSPGNIAAAIHSDSSDLPGTEVSNLTLSGPTSLHNVDGVYTCSGTGCSLSKDTTYHLVLSTTATGMLQYYSWKRSALTSETNTPSNAGWEIADSSSRKRGTNAWSSVSGNRPAKVKVVASVNAGGGGSGAPDAVASVTANRQGEAGAGGAAGSQQSGSIAASWPAANGATGYDVRYSADDMSTWTQAAANQSETSYTLNGADSSLAYVVGVRAVNDAGESAWTNSNAVPAAQPGQGSPPDSVASVAARRQSGSIIAGWDAVEAATGYDVVYTTDSGRSWSRAATNRSATGYTLAGADATLPYIIGVRAVNDAGESAWTNSNEVPKGGASISPPVAQPPGSVSSVSAGRFNGGIVANWEAVSGATKYHVTYSTDGGASWSLAAYEHTKKTITIDNADDSLPYIVGVRAGNDAGWSGWTNSNTVPAEGASISPPPDGQPPASVSSVSAGRFNGGIVANWEAVSGATKYHVTYSADGGASWSLAASEHTKKTITIDNADDSKSYIVGVRAGNDAGWSGWTNSNTVPAAGQ